MKLLFDNNLSPRLVVRLADLWPDSSHVALSGHDRASDQVVWEFAQANGNSIVTKDADFSDLSLLRGFPPRVVHLRIGNCTTSQIEALMRAHFQAISAFDSDPDTGTLELLAI